MPSRRVTSLPGLALLLSTACSAPPDLPAGAEAPARFVGRATCASCHAEESARWTGSDHDRAMEEVGEASVEGDFDDARFEHFGVASRFYRRDGGFWVRTDGPDGALADYEIAHTFGVRPLQQYLVAFPGGRLQALSLAWDARPAEAGGQRWFHLYPGEPIRHDDELHWTRPSQNWNFMCAECHSTGLVKGYRPDVDAYETRWEEIDVSCEACHGPGSAHVAWARAAGKDGVPAKAAARGLPVELGRSEDVAWNIDPFTGNARREPPLASRSQVETCGRCHARRSVTSEDYVHGRPLLDTHRVTLLEAGRYFADGQILDEVYVYGSFLQSRMYQKGVACTDCHDPHTLAVHTDGNALCSRCHLASKYDDPGHHHHRPGSDGARCVECHMPARLYMVVDARRDHSLRVPRPDLSLELGTPNACSGCHLERSVAWAAEAARRWWGERLVGRPHYGRALAAGRERTPGAREALVAAVGDPDLPGIVRATAASLLRGLPGSESTAALRGALESPDPLLRLGALYGMDGARPDETLTLAYPELADPVRTLRVEAARLVVSALASGPQPRLTPEQRAAVERGVEEYRAAQRVNADRADAYLNMGLLSVQLGEHARAEREYREGLRRDAGFVPLYVNLADLFRVARRDAEAERVLRDGIAVAPRNPDLHYALGLTLVRLRRLPEAVPELETATQLRPEQPSYAYAWGIALESAGRAADALAVLESAQQRHRDDRELLVALATISSQTGRHEAAVAWARRLVALAPGDPGARRLLAGVEAARSR